MPYIACKSKGPVGIACLPAVIGIKSEGECSVHNDTRLHDAHTQGFCAQVAANVLKMQTP